MSTQEILIAVLAPFVLLLVCSGPLIPFSVALVGSRAGDDHFRRNVTLLVVLTALQGVSFLPYILAINTGAPDSLYRLYLPFGLGTLLFLVGVLYCVYECLLVSREPDHTP